MTVMLNINGEDHAVEAQPSITLLEVLRDTLALTGAKRGCNQGVCGACTVLLDGRPVRACLSLAVNCTERRIATVEGLSVDAEPSPLQQAFLDAGAVQCGFCTSGMLMSAQALLDANPDPSIGEVRRALSGNLCRCTGYRKICEAVGLAASR